MRAAWVRAERDSEVRQAAGAWRDGGAIDDATLSVVEALYPTPWRRPSLLWGVLLFFFVSFFAAALLVSFGIAHQLEAAAFLLAAALAFAADRLRESASAVVAAAGGAAAFWSVLCLLIGIAEAWSWGTRALTPLLAIGAAACAAGTWRWGYPAFALLAAVFFFLLLARFPAGRVLWIGSGAIFAAASASLLDRPRLSPSHRRCAAAVLTVSLAALYGAVNLYALDHRFVEGMSGAGSAVAPSAAIRLFAAIATTAFAVLCLVWGIASRRTLLLDVAAVSAALSVATLRHYLHIGPLWVVLSVAGAALIFVALVVHRWLDRSPGRERGGFTAEPLFDDEGKQQTLGALGAVHLAPDGRSPAPAPEPGKFEGGGGTFGGAGSSGSF